MGPKNRHQAAPVTSPTLNSEEAENDLTLSSLHNLVFNPIFRQKCISRLETQEVRAFWKDEFPKYEKDRNNPLSPILNKVQKINLLPREQPIKSILCQNHPSLDFAEAILDQQIVLVNLNKGFIGDEATTILGALTTAAIMEAVLYINRPLIQDLQAPLPIGLWADEFPTFGTSLYRTILMEFRKLGLNKVTIASQHVEKIDAKLRADIFNAAKHKIVFSVEPSDADILAENYRRSTQDQNTSIPRTSPSCRRTTPSSMAAK